MARAWSVQWWDRRSSYSTATVFKCSIIRILTLSYTPSFIHSYSSSFSALRQSESARSLCYPPIWLHISAPTQSHEPPTTTTIASSFLRITQGSTQPWGWNKLEGQPKRRWILPRSVVLIVIVWFIFLLLICNINWGIIPKQNPNPFAILL